jgi:N-acetylmuramoyl-L-alanine amidase
VPETPASPVLTPDEAAVGGSPAADQPLLGYRIALDPGHGPRNDLGAVYVSPETRRVVLSEDVVNLDVAQRTRDLLAARGATVFLTREEKDSFTTPWPQDPNGDGLKRGQADDLQWRIDQINAFKAQVFLSIHANSHSNPNKRQGIQALACITDDCPFRARNLRLGKLALDHLEIELAAIGYPVTARELRNDLFSDGPGDPPGHLFLTGPAEAPRHPRAVTMPGAIVEALYITSPDEVQQLLEPAVRQAIARAYAAALEDFLLTPTP